MSTSVDFSVTVNLNGRTVNLNAGDLSKIKDASLVFALTHPITMGSAKDFVAWINANLHAGADISAPANMPEPFKTAYETFVAGNVILDTLVINQPAKTAQMGISYKLDSPVELIPGLGLGFGGIGAVITVNK